MRARGPLDIRRALGILWAKSPDRAGGTMNLLLSHLLDTAAVAGVMWDRFLPRVVHEELDRVAGGPGRGRGLLMWLCGIHDFGKATPSHQRQRPELAAELPAAGLGWEEEIGERYRWEHAPAGAFLLRPLLTGAGWPQEHIRWVWPLVAGHHGFFPVESALGSPPAALRRVDGDSAWEAVRQKLMCVILDELGFGDGLDGLAALCPARPPSRALQLQISGLVVMADWIASGPENFPGVDVLEDVSYAGARRRAEAAWAAIGLQGGFRYLAEPGPGTFRRRFGHDPRPVQELAARAARELDGPGLLIVEAPPGEGKTWAGLIAAETLAARTGAGGVFVGMPVHSTCDPMFRRVREWVRGIDEALAPAVALLHGRRTLDRSWNVLLPQDAVGHCGEEPAAAVHGTAGDPRLVPAQWFFDYARGLLCPFVVAPLDQLLYATTRTKFVMLRMAGLPGKVVVLDEIHAVDVHAQQYLQEGLRWLGQARVPVVLLSATLTAGQRRSLVDAYLAGAAGEEEYTYDGLPQPDGYPSVTAVRYDHGGDGAAPRCVVRRCASALRERDVIVEILPEGPEGAEDTAVDRAVADRAVAALLGEALADGGRALVVRNTAHRAQTLWTGLRTRFGDEVLLLHRQFTAERRAEIADDCLRQLAPGSPERPRRLIVVADQTAEQAFDVDVDLLVTDLAPIDLLLQRAGRLHRDTTVVRPVRLAAPRLVVTGTTAVSGTGGPPRFPARSTALYGRHPLLRAAHLVHRAARTGARLPGAVPRLVGEGYADGDTDLPDGWRATAGAAREQARRDRERRVERAVPRLLTRRGDGRGRTLGGLSYIGLPPADGDEGLSALVRDRAAAEAILLVRDGTGYRTPCGTALGPEGFVADRDDRLVDLVRRHTVELPVSWWGQPALKLGPLPVWGRKPKVNYRLVTARVLILDEHHRGVLGGRAVRYDADLGLVEAEAEAEAGLEVEADAGADAGAEVGVGVEPGVEAEAERGLSGSSVDGTGHGPAENPPDRRSPMGGELWI
ncbi:CRISPR-associated helicase/endonuclease Cas3 [Streptomyces clavuligerus]|uniref:Putative helicase n=1 Tax=Streptomyces clavuligerus TaxID=1901 RepID=E2PUN5_STRCL|nr:CRISPR-associated helicase/endonuclease Cas3 [Streptomyces clavuligerus]ANW19398.1 CRISPR-associated protein Cas3 [Streptomyces clavuligerus]AXU14006.1 CRISPR-associated helicase/endonuclease Cas3 [Streptomyces clavuligerus]EFG07814.1 Putative helicase [Streptomyces clavuligerus]MBY6303980.1 CRISPR-associated helicase/endonuclease Cas3 [Streptomyces clavuligerus]QCS06779.1 CRISPR-associated helicase/endonuclease Cas3 [Streptomyces clavuligerus]